MSKRFVNVAHSTITDYQMIVSNDLIIKSFDTEFQLCLIIKGLDNQAQKLNYQINQYPKKSLIVSLAGRVQGLSGAGRGGPPKSGDNHVTGMSVKGKQIGPDMIQAVRDEGGCIGHTHGKCSFGPHYKFPHLSDSVLQGIAKEVAERKKSAVALVADGKKDSPKGIAQPQGKGAPVMTTASDGAAVLDSFLTEFLNESALQNGAAAISERGVRGFGFHAIETENLHVFEEKFLDVMVVENLHVLEEEFLDVEEEILDVMEAENLHVLEEEFLDFEEEILDGMEAENLHVIEEERSVPV